MNANQQTNCHPGFKIIDGVRYPRIRDSDPHGYKRFWQKNHRNSIRNLAGMVWLRRSVVSKLSELCRFLFVKDTDLKPVWIVSIITLLYLCVEGAYSAWLLDVLSSNSTEEIRHKAELFGRAISGFSVALLFFSFIIKNMPRPHLRLATLFIVSGLSIFMVDKFETYVIEKLVLNSSAESRAAAIKGQLIREGLLGNVFGPSALGGMWDSQTSVSSSGKALLGVVAYMGGRSTSAVNEAENIKHDIVKNAIATKIGGLDGEFARFNAAKPLIWQRYSVYKASMDRLREEISDEKVNKLWEQYLDGLALKNAKWGRNFNSRHGELVPNSAKGKVIETLRLQGVPVTRDWKTGNKQEFVAAYRERLTIEAQQRSDGLLDNLTEEQFFLSSPVQEALRNKLGYPANATFKLEPNMFKNEFDKQVYQPLLAQRTIENLTLYEGKQNEYRDQERYESEGKKAFEAMITPAFALTLSMIGLITHIVKCCLLSVHLVTVRRLRNVVSKLAVITLLIVVAFIYASASIETNITSHPTYQAWIAVGSDKSRPADSFMTGQVVVSTLDAMIKLQTLAYPVFSIVPITVSYLTDLWRVDNRLQE